jgi:amino acid transporter
MSVTIVSSKEMTMFADVLGIIFWTSVKAAVCLSAFCLPLALLMIARRISKEAKQSIRARAAVVANILLAAGYGCLLLSRQMDTLYATAIVGYAVAFAYVMILWLIKTIGRAWRKLFGRPQTQVADDQIGTRLLVS